MIKDSITVHSSINQDLFRKVLFRSALISFIGLLPILYGAIWMDPNILSKWGIPIFFIGMAFIALGMIPFKRLTAVQKHPSALQLIDNQSIIYEHSGKKTMTIPLSMIESLNYRDNAASYGIEVKFKAVSEEKVMIHDPRFCYEKFRKRSRKQYGCDLFFPFFSKRAFNKLQECLSSST